MNDMELTHDVKRNPLPWPNGQRLRWRLAT